MSRWTPDDATKIAEYVGDNSIVPISGQRFRSPEKRVCGQALPRQLPVLEKAQEKPAAKPAPRRGSDETVRVPVYLDSKTVARVRNITAGTKKDVTSVIEEAVTSYLNVARGKSIDDIRGQILDVHKRLQAASLNSDMDLVCELADKIKGLQERRAKLQSA